MLIVIDDILDAHDLEKTQVFFGVSENRRIQWVDGDLAGPIEVILSHVRSIFDLTSMGGIEQWAHYGTKTDWHVDRDEALFRRTGKVVTPLCSVVFYADVQNLTGGKFMTDSVVVTPKINRLVAFAPGVRHGVEDYTGTRMAVAINPWTAKPEGY